MSPRTARQVRASHRPGSPRPAPHQTKIFSAAAPRGLAILRTPTCCPGLASPSPARSPVLNKRAVEMAMRAALAINCTPFTSTHVSRAKIISIQTCQRATRSRNTNCPWLPAAGSKSKSTVKKKRHRHHAPPSRRRSRQVASTMALFRTPTKKPMSISTAAAPAQ